MKKYSLADTPNSAERNAMGLKKASHGFVLSSVGFCPRYLNAIRTGEFRTPKDGEWYLSGAVIQAYKANNDLSTPYHIATLCKVEENYLNRRK